MPLPQAGPMEMLVAMVAGLASGGLVLSASRLPVLGWIALAPLAAMVGWASPTAVAAAAALAGGISSARSVWSRTMRSLLAITVIPSVLLWAGGFAVAAWLVLDDAPAWLALAVPVAAVVVHVPLRLIGAPRWVSNPLACTQEPWLPVIQVGRLGGDLAVTATLALASSAVVLGLFGGGEERLIAAALAAVVLIIVGFGALAHRAAVRRVDAQPTVRVAAVVADGVTPDADETDGLVPIQSEVYRDVQGTIGRYAPHVARAAADGAHLVVLPEVAVSVEDGGAAWVAAAEAWARRHGVAIVVPFFDAASPRNRLAIVDETGPVARYEKQHPGRGLEPQRVERTPVGPHVLHAGGRQLVVSAAICVDLDYADLIAPLRQSGGLLAAPSNDWFGGFEELHHRTAVWTAVLGGVTTVRATGHGISAVFDGAGRLIDRASSREHPVVLVVDAPVS